MYYNLTNNKVFMISFSSCIKKFLYYIETEKRLSPRTLVNYTHYLERISGFLGEEFDILELTIGKIEGIRIFLNRFKDKDGRGLTYKTQNYHLIALRAMLRFLQKREKPSKIVYLSSTRVYGNTKRAWVNEMSDLNPRDKKGEALLEAEKQVLNSGYPAVILRLAAIYGYGRNRIRPLIQGDDLHPERDHFLNMMHVEDVARAIVFLLEKGEPGQVYLGCDHEPVRRSEFYEWLGEKIGRPDLVKFPKTTKMEGKRCCNQRLKSLGFSFRYPTFREGYGALVAGV